MNRPFSITLALVLSAVTLNGAEASKGAANLDVLATVGAVKITQAEVEGTIESQLRKLDDQRQDLVASALERMIEAKLLDLEAASQGITSAQLIEREVNAKVTSPTPEEMDTYYEKNKSRLKQPKEQIATKMQQQMITERKKELRDSYLDGLSAKHPVSNPFEEKRAEQRFVRAAQIEKALDTKGHPSKGPENAPVTIVEFSDFQCPYCSRVGPSFDKIRQEYGDQVRIVFRQFPLNIHPNAWKAGEASLCAEEQGKFWEMHDLMFKEQQKLDVPSLKEKAVRLAMDAAKFDQCLDSGRFSKRISEDMALGQSLGVSGTPATFVNGIFLSGAQPFEGFKPHIDAVLKRAKAAKPAANKQTSGK